MNVTTLDELQELAETDTESRLARFRFWIYRNVESLKNLPHQVLYGIRNLSYWLPIIWHDRDWDQYFLYIILRHKLRRMERFFSTDVNFVGMEKEAENIKRAGLVLDRLIAEEYWQMAADFKHEERLIEQDLDHLFTILRKHIRHWWD